jgi:lipopolysaccharide/colanic/teichoic acid biosynthesis glycosyltransferase
MSALPDSRPEPDSSRPQNHQGDAGLRPVWLPRRTPFKRVLDIVLGSIALTLAMPVIACLVVIIRLDSRGPALYGQRRIGHLGRPFTLWKLRSMYHASSQAYHHQAAQDWFTERRSGERYKTESDPRITRVGRYLRRSSLDELPQLLNVLRGEMSLVGPRPLMPYDRPSYKTWYFEREVIRPGITGLWQVSGRDRLSAPEMMVLDVRYVREWSLWFDIQILARTVTTVIRDLRRKTNSISRVTPHVVEEA